ncbi:4-hydroxythreonine-4-phosphate dehydrogenase PdxA [Defluviitalea phaphyphila]|uniref:4-hydroxythreonine-4-phosphate dehydrogenase PdxA n=1 Tax=Defluviitalea phaphyphila TaxID=1473580 RepID=UPI00073051AA|nr:4-hydroxythreonine-4-phosphate dehydrogenase PdxA [Defluviitalea phaphyphila]
MNNKPLIGIPIGDPAGIGPEIVVKSLMNKDLYDVGRPIVVGDVNVVKYACEFCNITAKINIVNTPEEGLYIPGTIDIIDLKNVDIDKLQMGQEQAMCGRAAYEYIEKCIQLALEGKIDVVATSTINKKSLKKAGVPYIGHTEIFAGLTNTHDPLTMFEVRGMRVFFLSRHVSLRKACDMVTKERLLDYIERCTAELIKLGVENPKIAVAGLNPHSGEEGLFGMEEVNEVIPAIKEASEKGYLVVGPIGADSVFHLALQGRYDAVLSLYHDQGHIATKTLDFERTISLTVGMPFLRTSVDHGTAFDIAGKGIASEVSMAEAIRLAAKYGLKYRQNYKKK